MLYRDSFLENLVQVAELAKSSDAPPRLRLCHSGMTPTEPEPGIYVGVGLNFGNLLGDLFGRRATEFYRNDPDTENPEEIEHFLGHDEFGMDREQRLWKQLEGMRARPHDDPERRALREELFGALAVSRYAVADTIEQAREYWKVAIADPVVNYVISVQAIRRDPETKGKRGGWRWHKWGPYIGTHEPQCEYLDDEEGIDQVLIIHLIEVWEAPLNTLHCHRAYRKCHDVKTYTETGTACECDCRDCNEANKP